MVEAVARWRVLAARTSSPSSFERAAKRELPPLEEVAADLRFLLTILSADGVAFGYSLGSFDMV